MPTHAAPDRRSFCCALRQERRHVTPKAKKHAAPTDGTKEPQVPHRGIIGALALIKDYSRKTQSRAEWKQCSKGARGVYRINSPSHVRHADGRIQRKCGWSRCSSGVVVSSI